MKKILFFIKSFNNEIKYSINLILFLIGMIIGSILIIVFFLIFEKYILGFLIFTYIFSIFSLHIFAYCGCIYIINKLKNNIKYFLILIHTLIYIFIQYFLIEILPDPINIISNIFIDKILLSMLVVSSIYSFVLIFSISNSDNFINFFEKFKIINSKYEALNV